MAELDWMTGFPGTIVVCDTAGEILFMNPAACRLFAKAGGAELVGKNLLDCHPEPTRSKVAALLRDGGSHVYTAERNGRKRLFYSAPWSSDGRLAGLVELSFDVPTEIPNVVRS